MRRNEYSQVFTSIKSSKVNSSEVTGSCSTRRMNKESEKKRYFEALIVDDDGLLLPFCSILIRCVSLSLSLYLLCHSPCCHCQTDICEWDSFRTQRQSFYWRLDSELLLQKLTKAREREEESESVKHEWGDVWSGLMPCLNDLWFRLTCTEHSRLWLEKDEDGWKELVDKVDYFLLPRDQPSNSLQEWAALRNRSRNHKSWTTIIQRDQSLGKSDSSLGGFITSYRELSVWECWRFGNNYS